MVDHFLWICFPKQKEYYGKLTTGVDDNFCFFSTVNTDSKLFGIRIVSEDKDSKIEEWRKLSKHVKDCNDKLLLQEAAFENVR